MQQPHRGNSTYGQDAATAFGQRDRRVDPILPGRLFQSGAEVLLGGYRVWLELGYSIDSTSRRELKLT